MKPQLVYDGAGVYSPRLYNEAWIWIRNSNPLWGVRVECPTNAQKFANVIVLDEDGKVVEYLEKKER